jgi:hypothetical protein
MLGEAAILWQLSTQPEKGFAVKTGGSVPPYVYVVLGIIFLLGILRLLTAIENFRAASRSPEVLIPVLVIQAGVWVVFMLGTIAAFGFHHKLIAVLVLAFGATLPITKKKKAPKGTEDWPEEKPGGTGA